MKQDSPIARYYEQVIRNMNTPQPSASQQAPSSPLSSHPMLQLTPAPSQAGASQQTGKKFRVFGMSNRRQMEESIEEQLEVVERSAEQRGVNQSLPSEQMLIESVEMLPVDTVEQGSGVNGSKEESVSEGDPKNSGNLRRLLGFSSVVSLESHREEGSGERQSQVGQSIEEEPPSESAVPSLTAVAVLPAHQTSESSGTMLVSPSPHILVINEHSITGNGNGNSMMPSPAVVEPSRDVTTSHRAIEQSEETEAHTLPISAVSPDNGTHSVLSPDIHSLGQSSISKGSPERAPPQTSDFVMQTSLEPTALPPRQAKEKALKHLYQQYAIKKTQPERPRIPKPPPKYPENAIQSYMISHDGYEREVQRMITRYQRVAELKEKGEEIRETLSQLNSCPRRNQSVDNARDYFKEEEQTEPVTNLTQCSPRQQPVLTPGERDESGSVELGSGAVLEFRDELTRNVGKMERMLEKFKRISERLGQGNEPPEGPNDYEICNWQRSGKTNPNKHNHHSSEGDFRPRKSFLDSDSARKGPILKSESSSSFTKVFNEHPYPTHHCPDPINVTTSPQEDSLTPNSLTVACLTSQARDKEERGNAHLEQQATLAREVERLNRQVEELKRERQKETRSLQVRKSFKKRARKEQDRPSIDEDEREEGVGIPVGKGLQAKQQKPGMDELPTQRNTGVDVLPQSGRTRSKRTSDKRVKSKERKVLPTPERKPVERESVTAKSKAGKRNGSVDRVSAKPEKPFKMPAGLKIALPHISFALNPFTPKAELIKTGERLYRALFPFVCSRWSAPPSQLAPSLTFRITKYSDCVHYHCDNALGCHLVAYYRGRLYFGGWSEEGDGFKEGRGVYFHPGKYLYEGTYRKDRRSGEGCVNYESGEVYKGGWRDGKKEGWGVERNAVGDCYKGEYRCGRKEGKGEERLANGDVYRGQFMVGKLDGEGVYRWADGSAYEGGFRGGQLHGVGWWRNLKGDAYEGEYRANMKHGRGEYRWADGSVSCGYFKNDEFVGRQGLAEG